MSTISSKVIYLVVDVTLGLLSVALIDFIDFSLKIFLSILTAVYLIFKIILIRQEVKEKKK